MNNTRTCLVTINDLQFRLWEIMSDYRSQDDLEQAKEICSMLKDWIGTLEMLPILDDNTIDDGIEAEADRCSIHIDCGEGGAS